MPAFLLPSKEIVMHLSPGCMGQGHHWALVIGNRKKRGQEGSSGEQFVHAEVNFLSPCGLLFHQHTNNSYSPS
jgi:hypothetical protein